MAAIKHRTKGTEYLPYNKAVDLLHRIDTRLMKLHTSQGTRFFIVPGGAVRDSDAKKIIARPDVVPFDDGLFPGNQQSWAIGAAAAAKRLADGGSLLAMEMPNGKVLGDCTGSDTHEINEACGSRSR